MNTLSEYDWLSIVPAGGLGTRLGKLTERRTKPSIAVAFDEHGEITRMIDIPLKAIREIGGGALVSKCYAPESLDFVKKYDHVQMVTSHIDDSPIDTLLKNIALIEESRAEHIGLIPGDTDITAATLEEMRILLDVTSADAVLLATRQFEGHYIRSIDRSGMLCTPDREYDRVGDIGIHMFNREWLLGRLRACRAADPMKPREVWNDIYRVAQPAGRIYLYVPERDLLDVDMGTPSLFKKTIMKYNKQHKDADGNIVFPGATLYPGSKHCIALAGSKADGSLTHVVLPENATVTSVHDCLRV